MTNYTNNYSWLTEKFSKVMESHQEFGKTLREAGPLNEKDANLIQLGAAAAIKAIPPLAARSKALRRSSGVIRVVGKKVLRIRTTPRLILTARKGV